MTGRPVGLSQLHSSTLKYERKDNEILKIDACDIS